MLRPVLLSGLLLLTFGFVFPGLLWAVGRLLPARAAGSPVAVGGQVVGFERIGQKFTQARYFQGRPSAVDYNAASTGASNAGPSNPALQAVIQARLDTLLLLNPELRREQVPTELVTASASGIDPDLSPAGAYAQVARVAAARLLPPAQVRAAVDAAIEESWLGFMGPAHVSVLRLNLALDAQRP
ncbi:potassium-transporting ATPase subunit KdpC [Hymenobacter sp.]|uniref:potassium-transporting ATPase subunit KdpC n=1 Tax=Hymenobacter sp. TaxID=1898978 RepID=UPI00286B7532|nr:potassium-transporting ATPase subunit KdpC [Hymenobacter sp.]